MNTKTPFDATMIQLIPEDTIAEMTNESRLTLKKLTIASPVFVMISEAIHSVNPRQILFHATHRTLDIPLCKCGAALAWHVDRMEYRKYCSKKCTATYTVSLKKEQNLSTIGCEWHSQLSSWKEKVQETISQKYGDQFYSNRNDKIKATNLERYGVEHQMQLDSVKDKIKATNLERYGVENVAVLDSIQLKMKASCLAKYGVENVAKNKSIKEKSGNTRKNNYYSAETLEKLNSKDWLTEQHLTKTVGEIAIKIGVSPSNLCKYFHKHGIPINRHATSFPEKLIIEYYTAKGITLIPHDRSVIAPREIDIYFPDYRIGVEINGCYFHSEDFKEKHDHLNKTNLCTSNNIKLLQFWDFEVLEKFEQVINLINSKLNQVTRIFGRKTVVKEISSDEQKRFVTKNHLQGDVPSTVNLGLFHNSQLVMVATFGKARFTKNKTELLRLCSSAGARVIGGASKLVSYYVNNYLKSGNELISYCDRRYSNGAVYSNCGFKLTHISPVGFFYISKNGKYAGTRYQWQKHLLSKKLPNYLASETACANMHKHGYRKVWDCGQFVFSITKG